MGGFKKFLMQGNVIDLAVAVVIGAAFNAIVNSFVTHLLTPLISPSAGCPTSQP
jgi:large conductance mechanosensitive channel